jgi:RNA polymerase sigma-70 factor (ECF subfamily)
VNPPLEAGAFEDERSRLLGLAYRMTGSFDDAEDVVQETWLRWQATDRDEVVSPAAWLTTVATRVSLDRLKTAEHRRSDYVGEWLPEPVATSRGPEETAELAESLTLGFLVLLDQLSPVERAVFLLAEVFREPYESIAEMVGRSPAACRQVATRARRKLEAARVSEPPAGDDPALLERLVDAVLSADVAALVGLLDPEVVLVSDGGPTRRAARRPVVGPDRVARLVMNLVKRGGVDGAAELIEMNGKPALVLDSPVLGRLVTQLDAREGRITRIWVLLNPDKLHGLDEVVALA